MWIRGNASLEKGLDLLEHFLGERDVLALSELSRRSGMPKATVLRLLEPFVRRGFLTRSAGGYTLGLRFLEFSARLDRNLVLRRLALPVMEQLRDELDEAVQLAVVDGLDAVYIAKVDSRKPIRLYTREGRRAPLYAAACPRALLAFAPPGLEEQVLATSGQWRAYTPYTITDPETVRALLAEIRRTGYSVSRGELAEGSVAVAVPVMGPGGVAMAALSVAGPADRVTDERIPHIVERLNWAVAQIAAAAGCRRP